MNEHNEFKPKNTEGWLQFKTIDVPQGINETNPTRVYEDSKKGLNPALVSILRKERFIRVLSAILFTVLAITSVVGLIVAGVLTKEKGIGWYILFGLSLVISVVFLVKNLITYTAINKTEKQFRYNQQTGDAASHAMFAEMLKSLVHKDLRMTWIYLFFITYFGLFLLVLFGLKNIHGGIWEIGTPAAEAANSTAANTSFYIKLNWNDILNNAFGDVNKFMVIGLIAILAISLAFLFVLLYDKKRKIDLKTQLGSDYAAINAEINTSWRSENKAWIKFYVIVFVLVVLIPIAIFLYLIYKKVIRKGK